MRKLMLTILFSILGLLLINAQDLSINAGLIRGTFKSKVDGSDVSSSSSETGFYVGLGVDFKVSEKTNIKPLVLYSNIQETNFLNIPLMLKYFLSEKFNLQAGPQGTFILEDTGDLVNAFGLDLTIGLGYDIDEHFFIEGRYSFEITNRTPDAISTLDLIDDSAFNESYDLKTRYNALMIGIGYKFN